MAKFPEMSLLIPFSSQTISWDSSVNVLRTIINDTVFTQSSSSNTRKRWELLLEQANLTLNKYSLFSALEELYIVPILDSALLLTLSDSSLVTRILLCHKDQARYIYLKPDLNLSVSQIDLDNCEEAYILLPRFPRKPIPKFKFALMQFSPLWRKYLFALFFSLLTASISILPLVVIGPIFNTIVPRAEIPQLLLIGFAVLLAQLIGNVIQFISSLYTNLFENDISFRSYLGVVDRFLSAQLLSLPQRDVGLWSQTFRTAIAFTSSIRTIFVNIPLSFFTILLNCIAFGVTLSKPWIVIFLLSLSLLPGLLSVFFGWQVGKISFKLVTINSQIDQHLYKTIESISDIRGLNYEPIFDNQFTKLRQQLNKVVLSMNSWTQTGIFASSTLNAFLTASILFLYSKSSNISQGSYLVIFVAFASVSSSFTDLAQSISQLLASAPTYFSKNPLRDIDKYSLYKNPSLAHLSQHNPNQIKSIELVNVSFNYISTSPVIQNFSSLFQAGSSYLITGESGSGKSSLLKIISGLYSPLNGQVLVNGLSNTSLVNNLINYNVIFIPQSQKLLGDTLREFLDPFRQYSDEQLFEALSEVSMLDFTKTLPMKLSTVISEFCTDMSSGQIQLYHAARVVLNKPDVLLSDEPTCFLSSDSSRFIIQLLNTNSKLHISSSKDASLVNLFTSSLSLHPIMSLSQ